MFEKPKMYQNKVDKEIRNNREVFMSSDRSNTNHHVWSSNDIRKKINDLVNSTSFIYHTKVNIVIGNEVIVRKIVGIYNNNLVTIDNEYIPIDSITDVYK